MKGLVRSIFCSISFVIYLSYFVYS